MYTLVIIQKMDYKVNLQIQRPTCPPRNGYLWAYPIQKNQHNGNLWVERSDINLARVYAETIDNSNIRMDDTTVYVKAELKTIPNYENYVIIVENDGNKCFIASLPEKQPSTTFYSLTDILNTTKEPENNNSNIQTRSTRSSKSNNLIDFVFKDQEESTDEESTDEESTDEESSNQESTDEESSDEESSDEDPLKDDKGNLPPKKYVDIGVCSLGDKKYHCISSKKYGVLVAVGQTMNKKLHMELRKKLNTQIKIKELPEKEKERFINVTGYNITCMCWPWNEVIRIYRSMLHCSESSNKEEEDSDENIVANILSNMNSPSKEKLDDKKMYTIHKNNIKGSKYFFNVNFPNITFIGFMNKVNKTIYVCAPTSLYPGLKQRFRREEKDYMYTKDLPEDYYHDIKKSIGTNYICGQKGVICYKLDDVDEYYREVFNNARKSYSKKRKLF